MPTVKLALRAIVVFLLAFVALSLVLATLGNIGGTELTIVIVVSVGLSALDAWRVSKRSVQQGK
ncbi:hypothetical protein SAMN04488564_104313 [Lentzea waywayandensis]|uniref:Uncharacterized protein n=1 Tax=Lentzea waywayandensis TaxID=84724 RepID=A0A1I6EF64_9PSEU|nr:hypothetical protein [Lentzea waywayandensis]SFR16158.1 hypothetical protein SAMN04488564_104313 [Lentzea waywayandensis]